jgi:hypothetical protein
MLKVSIESDEEWDDFINEILEFCPDHFDGDESAESIAIEYVRTLERVAHVVREENLTNFALSVKDAMMALDGNWED